jgi:hypothetical protein
MFKYAKELEELRFLLILTEDFAVDLGRFVCWGETTLPAIDQLLMYSIDEVHFFRRDKYSYFTECTLWLELYMYLNLALL